MRKSCLAGLTMLVGAVSSYPAYAQDIDVNGTLTGGLQFGSGGAGLTTGVSGQASSRTRTTNLTASGNATFAFSDGDEDLSLSGRLRASRALKRGQIFAGASYSRLPSTFEAVTDDFTLELVDGTRIATGIDGGFSYALNTTLSSSVSLSYTNLEFDPTTVEQVSSDDYNASFRLNYAADRRTSLNASLGLGWFTSENAVSTESLSASVRIGGTQALTQRSQISGSAGLSFINTEEEVGGVREASWSTALLFDANLTNDYADGTLNLGVSQRISPTAEGNLALNTSLNAGLSYTVNSRMQLGLTGSVGRQSVIDGATSSTVVSITPTFAYQIVEGLDATARVTLRDAGNSTSQRFGIGLSRKFGNASP